jgi:hypothetical protein
MPEPDSPAVDTHHVELQPVAGHPQVCGEDGRVSRSVRDEQGPPPRMRGRPHDVRERLGPPGATPAHAGKTRWTMTLMPPPSSHPRACGGRRYFTCVFFGRNSVSQLVVQHGNDEGRAHAWARAQCPAGADRCSNHGRRGRVELDAGVLGLSTMTCWRLQRRRSLPRRGVVVVRPTRWLVIDPSSGFISTPERTEPGRSPEPSWSKPKPSTRTQNSRSTPCV